MKSIRKGLVMKVAGPPRERGRPKRMWMKVLKIDVKNYNLSENLAQY